MRKIKILLATLTIALATQLSAQSFTNGMDGFSKKKPAKITLSDGTEVEGLIQKLKRKKGNFISITIENEGGKTEYASDQIKHMYLAPSGLQKVSSGMQFASNINKWDKSDLDPALIEDGYAYFETTKFKKKKKTFTGIMQLVNTTSAGDIRVYFDPLAKSTASAGIGGVTLVGGIDKSYYIKNGDEPAIFTNKSEYKKNGINLYGDCQEAKDAYNASNSWGDFPVHVQAYFDNCDK